MKKHVDLKDRSFLREEAAAELECDGNCACVTPCPNCKGRPIETNNDSHHKSVTVNGLPISRFQGKS